jgi:hypothetical protein
MRRLIAMALLAFAGSALAADSPRYKFSLALQADDADPVLIDAALPPGSHTLQATPNLRYIIETKPVEQDKGAITLSLVSDSSGSPVTLVSTQRSGAPSGDWIFVANVCEGHLVLFEGSRITQPKCSTLKTLAKGALPSGQCWWDCYSPYDEMPEKLTSRSRIAPVGEPGVPLVLTGLAIGADGKPQPGVIVYAYHTDEHGIYPESNPKRRGYSNAHGRLRGWAITDARGRYTFDTIRPAGYPSANPRTGEPQHIHMHIVEPGCTTYWIDELLFSDDIRLTPDLRERIIRGYGGNSVGTPKKEGKGWKVERDIQLGEKIQNYPACGLGAKPNATL